MMTRLDLPTIDARASGLRARLFGRAELEALAGAPSIAAFTRELELAGRLLEPIERPASTATVESAIRHTAALHLRVLSRWAGPGPALDVFYADQDRRSLRALMRGALQAAPSEERLAGLLPTPRLPERALTLLARQPTPARVAAQLVLLQHPDAGRLSALTARAHPVLLDLERALVSGFAERSLAAARGGDRNLREVARQRIDVCNLEMALTFASGPRDVEPSVLFTEGGSALVRAGFVEACRAPSVADATRRLEHALEGSPLQSVARSAGGAPARLELLAFRQVLLAQRRVARLDPLGSAPLVLFMLRLQAQSDDLRRLAWGATLGAPAEMIRAELVTPWN
jgi:vacuolar-type H+-ATPase subunit C/Vma6